MNIKILLPITFLCGTVFLFAQDNEEPIVLPQRPQPQINPSFLEAGPDVKMFGTAEQPQLSAGRTAKGWHVLLSLVVPGAGEWAGGRKDLGKVFLGSDIVLWLGFLGTEQYIDILQSDLEAFAAAHAGVDSRGKGDQYWIDVGLAADIYEFNADRLLERDTTSLYMEGAGFDWQWDSEDNRVRYAQRRFKRLDWKRAANWWIAGLVLNRIVSAIDVIRLIRKNPADGQARKSMLNVNYAHSPYRGDTMKLNLTFFLR